MVTPKFLTVDAKSGKPTFVTVHAKIARGAFARWLVTGRVKDSAVARLRRHRLPVRAVAQLSQRAHVRVQRVRRQGPKHPPVLTAS